MLLVTEFEAALDTVRKLPPSLIDELYLLEGGTLVLDTKPRLFGKPFHVIHLGHNLRQVEKFVTGLKGDTSQIILVAPLSKWGIYTTRLKTVEGLTTSDQFDSRESKVQLVRDLTGLNKKNAQKALSILKYNFSNLQSNLDLLKKCASTGEDVETALASVEKYSFSTVLFYLCGDKTVSKESYIRTLSRYRYAKKVLLKYLKDNLDAYIDYVYEGIEPKKDLKLTVSRLTSFLYLEDAMVLRQILEGIKDVPDLLKGEL